MKSLVSIVVSLVCLVSFSVQADVHSAARFENETFDEALARYQSRLGVEQLDEKSARESAVPWKDLKLDIFKSGEKLSEMKAKFFDVRDLRFLTHKSTKEMKRRLSWLYPDDGCFWRAEWMSRKMASWGFNRPKKLFIFGSLKVDTKNHPKGYVKWWYHVVTAFVNRKQLYVFDPALNPNGLMLAKDWALLQVKELKDAKFALCDGKTFAPSRDCLKPEQTKDSAMDRYQKTYLQREFDRQEKLERDPMKVLGDSPPWSTLLPFLG